MQALLNKLLHSEKRMIANKTIQRFVFTREFELDAAVSSGCVTTSFVNVLKGRFNLRK